jgi:hypothetical protein
VSRCRSCWCRCPSLRWRPASRRVHESVSNRHIRVNSAVFRRPADMLLGRSFRVNVTVNGRSGQTPLKARESRPLFTEIIFDGSRTRPPALRAR